MAQQDLLQPATIHDVFGLTNSPAQWRINCKTLQAASQILPDLLPYHLSITFHPSVYKYSMRLPSFPTLIRAFYTFNATASRFFTPASRTTINPTLSGPRLQQQLRSSMPIPFIGALFSSSAKSRDMADYPVKKSDDEWRAQLSPEQFRVLRQQGTEAPFVGKYDKHMPSSGEYTCAACNAPLYKANHKFKSGCGWPAFFDAVPGAVTRHTDRTLGMERTEIVCSNCGGHLGHVFKGEGYDTPTDERHCVNSISINFGAEDGKAESKV